MWVMNLGKPVKIHKLNEAMAIELGASLLSEVIIFFTAAGLLIAEVNRQARKEAKKEAKRREELGHIHYIIQELYIQAKRQDTQITEILRTLSDIENKVMNMPLKGKPSEGTPPRYPPPINTKPGTDSIHDINYYRQAEFEPKAQSPYWWPESQGVVFTVSCLINNVVKNYSKEEL